MEWLLRQYPWKYCILCTRHFVEMTQMRPPWLKWAIPVNRRVYRRVPIFEWLKLLAKNSKKLIQSSA
jgi:hypothetical protein